MESTRRGLGGHFRHLGAAAVTAIVASAGCGGGSSDGNVSTPSVAASAASVAGYRVLEPGAFIAGFPADPLDMQSELLLERGWDLAIGVGPDEIYVLDTFAKHVLRLDRDANLRAIIGGPGGGPGEFENPYSIEADPRGGVWVADSRLARMSRFDADGSLVEELRVPEMVRGFTVLPDGAVLYRQFDGEGFSLTVQSGEDAVDLAGELPQELAPEDFQSLWAEYDLEFAVVASDTVVAFRNTDVEAYGAWRIALDISAGRIIGAEPVAFPAWLTEEIAAQAAEIRQEFSETGRPEGRGSGVAGRTTIPFSRGVRMSLGDLWVTPHSAANLALATTIPLSVEDSVSIVPRVDRQSVSNCVGLDYAIVGMRLVELCMEQVRIYELLPSTPGPPPFAAGPM